MIDYEGRFIFHQLFFRYSSFLNSGGCNDGHDSDFGDVNFNFFYLHEKEIVH